MSCTSEESESADPEGSPCTVQDGCPDNYICKMFDESCGALQQGECRRIESGRADCSFAPPNACTCSGALSPAECVEFGDQYITEAASCSTGTFACGDKTCTNVVEACLEEHDASGTTYSCIAAAEHGCSAYGVADCACLRAELASGTCSVGSAPTEIMIAVATVGPECNLGPCALDQACVDFVTDMGSSTQCRQLTDCTECACAIQQLCTNTDAVCEVVPGGLRLSECGAPI
ncbi:MAG: hypothetical protein HOV80_29920 [Polyangiaceae bacterium]|nr:hypothetical protein [Polyangiaceae bacterium]